MQGNLRVTVEAADGIPREFEFSKPFRIGRTKACDICIEDEYVSRTHAEVAVENGQWRVKDLGSSNGLFYDGERVESLPIGACAIFRLGVYGPKVSITFEEVKPAAAPAPVVSENAPGEKTMVVRYAERYFGKTNPNQPMGEQTMFIRRAFEQVQKKEKRKYGAVVAVIAAAMLAASAYALYLHEQVKRQKDLAENIFYSMKSLDVNIAGIQKLVSDSGNQQARSEMERFRAQRRQMDKNYDQLLSTLHVYDQQMTQEQKLILRVARIFGECELSMPAGFVSEVQKYIKEWQSSGRLAKAIGVAQANGYVKRIAQEMLDQGLPPQFFYLALQESNFDQYVSGPRTRKGIAKGMWQFIPETAEQYGLKVGPLVELPRPDPADDRHHWELETRAAARYIRDLYGTDAQASGLLVMACYNWGEKRVLPLVQSLPMPANPRDRNFWVLLSKYKDRVPDETYNYVFMIVSAAVIGENPELFGFDFANPLGYLERK